MRAEASSRLPRLTRTLPPTVAIALLFLALTALVTYPQVRALGTSVPYHSDPYFSMWRLAWVAHAIHTDPRALFEANIFYPAHDTLGYSDAMLLPGTAAAPLFWAGINPVLIYNLALFAAFALSGYAAFLLATGADGQRRRIDRRRCHLRLCTLPFLPLHASRAPDGVLDSVRALAGPSHRRERPGARRRDAWT